VTKKQAPQLLFDRMYGPLFYAIEVWATDFMEQMALWVESVLPTLQAFYDAVHAEYMACGAPYGDTQEGMLRWIEERCEIQRLRTEADRLEQRHRDMVEWRELGRRIARRRACIDD